MVIITAGAGFYLGSLPQRNQPLPRRPDSGPRRNRRRHLRLQRAESGPRAPHRRASCAAPSNRPMAAGRISLAHGLLLGFAAIFLGSLYLAYTTNLLTGTLTLLTAIGYVGIYTPLKRITVDQHLHRCLPRSASAADRLDRRPRRHRVARRRALRHPLRLAVSALHGHRLDVPRRLRRRRNPPHPHAARCAVRRPLAPSSSHSSTPSS